MKSKQILILATSAMIAVGCATTGSNSTSTSSTAAADAKSAEKQAKQEQAKNQNEKDPEKGMTREQVRAMYGKPDRESTGSDGEMWYYNVNAGSAYIPFNYGYRPKVRTIIFNAEGKVSAWSLSK